MSTLAAARADNFYYPPEWTPEQGGLNKFRGSHGALGKRANKIHEGILVIRFELPYNCWCLGCNSHIGKGVRYNAEKKKVGAYFTTPILEFSMKCYWCDTTFVIRTDPKGGDYEFVSGIRRKVEEFSPEDNELPALKTDEEKLRIEKEPLYRIELGEDDKRKAKAQRHAVAGEDLCAFAPRAGVCVCVCRAATSVLAVARMFLLRCLGAGCVELHVQCFLSCHLCALARVCT